MSNAVASLLPQDGWAFLITTLVALTWLGLSELATARGWLPSIISRKAVHVGTGPLYVMCWELFSNSTSAPWAAACVPGLVSIRFALIGLGIIKDVKTVMSMSRSGAANELLAGPLLYGVIHVLCTVVYWRAAPLGVLIIAILCLGDGMADVMGRNFGQQPLPWNKHKTWMGLAAFFVSALACCIALVHMGYSWRWHDIMMTTPLAMRIAMLVLVCALTESVSAGLYDNLAVCVVAVVAGKVLRL